MVKKIRKRAPGTVALTDREEKTLLEFDPRNAILHYTEGGMPRYNWAFIKRMFIEGLPDNPSKPDGKREWLNLRQLSERLDVPYQKIRDHSAEERWLAQREAYQATAIRKRQADRAKRLFDKGTAFDDLALDVADRGLRLVNYRLTEMVRDSTLRDAARREVMEAPHLSDMDRIELLKELPKAASAMDLERLAKAGAMFQEMGMKSIGTDVQKIQVGGDPENPIEATVSVAAELERDDPDRLGGFLAAAIRSGLTQKVIEQAGVIDGEFTEEDIPEPEYVESEDADDDGAVEDMSLEDTAEHVPMDFPLEEPDPD